MKPPGASGTRAPNAGKRAFDSGDPPRSRAAALPKADRLRRRQEFRTAQAKGRKLYSPHFGVCLAAGPGPGARLGLAVGRRLGKAVRRNRVKRWLREFFRRHRGELPPMDLIIMAKKGAAELTYAEVEAELARLLLAYRKADDR